MLATFLVEHPWLVPVAFVAVVVLGPALGYRLVGRPEIARRLGIATVVPVALLTLTPTSRDLDVGCAVEWSVPTFGAVELMGNVLLFAPPALLLGLATRRPLLVLLGASGASALVEGLQASATVLGRSCSTNDWLSNTLGAALGVGLAAVVLAASGRGPRPLGDR